MDNEIKIDVRKYMSEDDIRDECLNQVGNVIRSQLRTESDIKRFISNISYEIVIEYLNTIIPDFEELIRKGVQDVVTNGISSYLLFRPANGWGDKDSVGLKILEEELLANRNIIKDKVVTAFETVCINDIGYHIADIIKEVFVKRLDEVQAERGVEWQK